MNNPQERVIKKMIDNIVEQNRPVFERPASVATAAPVQTTPASNATGSSPAPSAGASSATPPMTPEDYGLLSRKIEYGFNSLRGENAELRKQLEEMSGAIKMLRNDMDTVRMAVAQRMNPHMSPAPSRDESESQAPRGAPSSNSGGSGGMGAPQYRKTAADEAYERETGQPAHHDEAADAAQPRGFAKKEDKAAQIDINKVFYYGKK